MKPKSVDFRAKLLSALVGMAKEAGYDLDGFVEDVTSIWPLVKDKPPSGAYPRVA